MQAEGGNVQVFHTASLRPQFFADKKNSEGARACDAAKVCERGAEGGWRKKAQLAWCGVMCVGEWVCGRVGEGVRQVG